MSKKRNKSSKKSSSAHFPLVNVPCGSYDVVIVGGGASGLASAIAYMQSYIRQTSHASASHLAPHPRVAIVEAGKRIGTSIMRSGNGRCNFSNASLDLSRYYHASFVKQAFSALEENAEVPSVLAWFEQLGLVWEEMPGSGGLLYPFSKKANSVLDVLRKALDAYGVEICEMSLVETVRTDSKKAFLVSGKTHKNAEEWVPFTIEANSVVLASGGITPQDILSEKHLAYRNPRPLLGPLQAVPLVPISLKSLDGIRIQAKVMLEGLAYREEGVRREPDTLTSRSQTFTLRESGAQGSGCRFEEKGEVLFRDYGLSGIVIFNASRYAQPGDVLLLDLMPSFDEDKLRKILHERFTLQKESPAYSFFVGFVVNPLAEALLKTAGIASDAVLKESDIEKLVHVCKAFPFRIEGIADERTCQVHRGGVQPEEVDPHTMEVYSCPGLFITGEALDVDGPCGGYNLHWAWTTGLLSGNALAHRGVKSSLSDVAFAHRGVENPLSGNVFTRRDAKNLLSDNTLVHRDAKN